MLPFDLGIVERGVRGIFAREFLTRQRVAKYTKLCTVVDSDKEEEKYAMISTLPNLAEMKDERVLSGFSEYSYTIKNKVYATGIKVPRRLFEYDQTGQLRTLIQSLASRVANFPDQLVWQLIKTNGICYDKKNFFGTDHDLGDGTSQINTMDGHQTNTLIQGSTKNNRDDCIAAFQLDLVNAKAALLALKDDRGLPWHDDAAPEGLAILCHPRNEFFVRTAIEATMISDTGNLTMKTVGQVITTNYDEPFKDDSGVVRYGTWYLFKLDTPIQPFIFQRFGPKVQFPDPIPEADQSALQALSSVEIQSVMRTGQNISEWTFFNDEFLFGARVHYSAGYGMWQNAIKVKASDYT